MKDIPDSIFQVAEATKVMDVEFFEDLKKVDKDFAEKLSRAVTCANHHGLGVLSRLADPTNLSSVCTAFLSSKEKALDVDEAMILAVEMYDIFHNNPHVAQIPVELGYGRKIFLIGVAAGQEGDIAIIVLNKKGEYLTSYDQTRKEFFPIKIKVPQAQLKKLDAFLVEHLDKLYNDVRSNISKVRVKIDAEEGQGE